MSGNVCLCEAGGGWCHSPLLVSPSKQCGLQQHGALTDVMERMDGLERIEAAPWREEVSLCRRNVTGHHLSFNHLLEGGATYFWCC